MIERTIFDTIADCAERVMPGWQIPHFGEPWPQEEKRLELEIKENAKIDPDFSTRRVKCVISLAGGGASESAALFPSIISSLYANASTFNILRIECGESESIIDQSTKTIHDTQEITLYIEPITTKE